MTQFKPVFSHKKWLLFDMKNIGKSTAYFKLTHQ